jgi:hypothetical protein
MLNPHIQTLVRLLAEEAAKNYLKYPDAINLYYSTPKSKRSALVKEARTILGKKVSK